jgi:hypothetical protein
VIIEIYGKKDCKLCESAHKKVEHFLQKWELGKTVRIVFQDMTTEHGAAEGDFFDVFQVPSVLLKRDADSVVARWDGEAPPSEELQQRLCA